MVCGMSSSNASNLLRHGVSPSRVGIPANTHLSAIEFLVQRFPAIQREVWLQRFLEGGILNSKRISIAPNQSDTALQSTDHFSGRTLDRRG